MKRCRKSLVCAVLALLMLAVGLPTQVRARAESSAPRVVRISYGYDAFLQADDQVTGLCADYLAALARVNNWQYEYVKATWSEALDMLAGGEIDFLFPVSRLPEREELMDFCTMPMGYMATGIFAMAGGPYAYEDFDNFNGARIALSIHTSNYTELSAYAQENGFSYQTVYMNSNAEMIEALRAGQVDLAVFSASASIPGATLVATMDAKPLYFAVRQGNTDMLAQLDHGMQALVRSDPSLVADLMHKTLVGENATLVGLTQAEREFLRAEHEVVIGFYQYSEPLAYIKDDGSYDGIFVRVLHAIDERTDLNIRLCPIGQDKSWEEMLKDGDIDFYVGASDVIASSDPELITTDAFMTYSNVLVTMPDCAVNTLKEPVIALTYGRANWAGILREQLGHKVDIRYYHTYKECLMAVFQGEADACLINNLEFNYQSKNSMLSSMIQWPQFHFSTELSLAASTRVDPVMFSTVNKSLALLDQEFINNTVNECLNMPYRSYSLGDLFYIYRTRLIFAGLVLLAIAAITTVFILQRNKQRAMQLKAQEREQHQLQMLAAMSYDYAVVYYVDLDENVSQPIAVKKDLETKLGTTPRPAYTYSAALRQYIETYVLPGAQPQLLPYTDPGTVLRRFEKEQQFSLSYQIRRDVREQDYFEMHFVQVENSQQDHRMMVLGIRCVDDAVQEAEKQRQILQDALDGANRANAAKSEFFSRMSHDIRTPLNAVIGMTAIAEAHAEDPARVRDALAKITNASRHLLSLINDVLDMSKIETGKMSLSEEKINLNKLVNGMLDIVRPQMQAHQHRLHVNIPHLEHEDVLGDSLRIQQMFVNLMSNAIKYTPDGGDITLSIRELPLNTPSAGCYQFVFADTGIGMTKEFQERLFEPFVRAEDLRISKIQGTGLGLAITQNIVQMMNGQIEVESELGKGSTFTVTIFLKLQDVGEDDTSDLSGLTVLVADDDPDARESLSDALASIGMRSICCASGLEALAEVEKAQTGDVSLFAAILDWRMPELNGMETAQAIRRITGSALPIILFSSYDWSDVEAEARPGLVDVFMRKPVFRSDLLRQLSHLRNGTTRAEAAAELMNALPENDYAGRRILLVEDNALNREIACEILEMASLTVEEAENGEQAVSMFSAAATGHYDLILMDIQMPVMNGLDAAKAIRALPRPDAQSVPIVAMTANAFVEDIQASKAAGMNEHLAKPIDFDQLNRVLKQYLSDKPVPHA